MFKLTIEDDEGKTTVVPLARDEITIGRLEGNTIRLTERNVSRRHARLVRQNGALYIEDLSSFTGVRVNGAKIVSPTPLREGDEVQIGDYRLGLRGERTTAPITDRPTMPAIPAIAPQSAPMGTVGGSVAIPTRASVAAMAAQPAQPAAAPAPIVAAAPASPAAAPAIAVGSPAVAPAAPASPAAAPAASALHAAPVAFASPAAAPAASPAPSGPSSPSATITQPGPAVRKSPPQPQPLAGPMPAQPVAAPPRTAEPAPAPNPAHAATPAPAQQPPAAKSPQPAPLRPAAAVVGAPSVSDAQPTIPIRALGNSSGEPGATEATARLVVLTTDLQGMEFELDRASLVIGRTDENDVVLPHRSISRHHAKVVRDGDHHTIVDLQSANGVRVNGEDYERIELNAGDIIELGHVKLRFVGALENYVFRPGVVGGGSLKLKLGAVGIGLVGLAAVALVLYRKVTVPAGANPAPAVAQASAPTAPPPPQPVAAAPAVPTAVTPPALPVAATAAAMLAEARQAAGAEDWDKSKVALDKIGTTIDDPGVRKDATTLRRRVDVELQASVQFAQFDEASGAKNYAEALARYEQIPAESIYKRRAKPRYDEARTLLVAEHMAAADKARAAGKCAEVRSEVAEVIRLEPRNLLAKDLVRLCKPRQEAPAPAVVARPARPRPSPSLAVAEAPSRPERPEAPAPKPRHEAPAGDVEAGDPDALMKQAREAWLRQQCGAAVDLSRKALHAKPGMTDAYQIIAVCSCTLKDVDAAGRAYAKLDDKNRSLVRQLCQKNGVSVGE